MAKYVFQRVVQEGEVTHHRNIEHAVAAERDDRAAAEAARRELLTHRWGYLKVLFDPDTGQRPLLIAFVLSDSVTWLNDAQPS